MTRRFEQFGLAVVLIALIALVAAADARPRGTKNTQERDAYCRSKLNTCFADGVRDCNTKHPNDAKAAITCYNATTDACSASFGDGSTCRTEEKVTPDFGPNSPDRPRLEKPGVPPRGE
jgi:hypothetical protein